MNQVLKRLLFGAAALGLTAAGCVPAAAASIDRIRVRLKAEDFDEKGMPLLEAESRDEAYSVTGVECISGDSTSGPAKKEESEEEKRKKEIEKEPEEEQGENLQYELELESDSEDYFSVLRQEDIQFSGLKAVCRKAIRKDNGNTLLLTFELQDVGEILGTIEMAEWMETGNGSWKKAPGAVAYLVMLYCDSRRIGHPHRTRALQYDFSPLMQKAGVYHFKVIPLTKSGKRGEPKRSGWRRVNEEETVRNREKWSGKTPGWQGEGESPSYILMDGSYPQNDSIQIGEEWQSFDGQGLKIDAEEQQAGKMCRE